MVPGPKARMQDGRVPPVEGRGPSFNGARPEGQDAGQLEAVKTTAAQYASMVPGPKARMQVADAMLGETRANMLQWCPARRPGCRDEGEGGVGEGAPASMVPGPKARMQVVKHHPSERANVASMVPGPKARMQERLAGING